MYILGIWDGHDSGAAIIEDGRILAAVNEERFTRRKLEVCFPYNSIRECLNLAEVKPEEIREVAVSSSDFSKTLARIFPGTKEEYYLIRRRKKLPGRFTDLKKRAKYILTEFGPTFLSRGLSRLFLRKNLTKAGLGNYNLYLVDHHLCHAATAAFASGFGECVVITMDGIGDALSGTVSIFSDGKLERKSAISGRNSMGIFFEHVTNLMNMRELEDEGKVMAIANYAYPVPDDKNELFDFITVEGLDVRCRFGSLRTHDELKKVFWKYPSEQFAYMAQRTLEVKVLELVNNAVKATGFKKVALAGGLFSNIKINMLIRNLPGIKNCFVFPHMGDGGLAMGAAFWANHLINGIYSYPLDDLFLGPGYRDDEIKKALDQSGLEYSRVENIEDEAAELIARGYIVFWFHGKMEYGPRALGGRSILALPDSNRIRNLLNLRLKMRVWYQPFCPSMRPEDAQKYLADYDGPNPFMTMGYMVKEDKRSDIEGVISVDGSSRPQVINSESSKYGRLLKKMAELTGRGVILNTSFNIHGEPLVCSPADAIDTFKRTKNEYMVMDNYLVRGLE